MAQVDIVTGFWVDYAQSPFHRARLTLTNNGTDLLLVALAVLTAVTGEYLWQILCQLLFLRRATAEPRDGLYHQTQLALRNDDSPGEFSWNMFRLGVAWGKRRGSFRWRTWRWGIFGLVMLIVNNASSFWLPVLSSEGQVLIKGPLNNLNVTLGRFPDNKTRDDVYQQLTREQNTVHAGEREGFSSYAASCYPDLGYDITSHRFGVNMCGLFVERYLKTTVSFPGVCPFAEDLCAVPLDQVIRVDSGRINSHDHLGLNSPPHARVEIQTSITCSPLRTDGYMTPDYVDHNGVNDTLLFYYGDNWYAYPQGTLSEAYSWERDTGTNITYYYTKAREVGKERPIALYTASEDRLSAASNAHVPAFNMSSALRTSDARTTIYFLSNRLDLQAPVSDPWFNNTRVVPGFDGQDYYGAFRPVSPLGCTQTHSFCNPNTDQCIEHNVVAVPFLDPHGNDAVWDELALNPEQRSVAYFMAYASRASTLGEPVMDSQGTDQLMITRMFDTSDPSSFDLPDNQWQHEVQNFMNLALSMAQGNIMTFIEKPTPLAVQWGMINPRGVNPDYDYVNTRIKMRSHRHQSFSVSALALVFVTQGLIILAGLYMQFLWPWLRLRKPDDSPDHNRGYKLWQLMGAMQLHRCLHQLLGRGRWRGAWHQIPTTDPGSLFSEYDKLPWQPYVTFEQEQALSRTPDGEAFRHGGVVVAEVNEKESTEEKCDYTGANSSADTLKHA